MNTLIRLDHICHTNIASIRKTARKQLTTGKNKKQLHVHLPPPVCCQQRWDLEADSSALLGLLVTLLLFPARVVRAVRYSRKATRQFNATLFTQHQLQKEKRILGINLINMKVTGQTESWADISSDNKDTNRRLRSPTMEQNLQEQELPSFSCCSWSHFMGLAAAAITIFIWPL